MRQQLRLLRQRRHPEYVLQMLQGDLPQEIRRFSLILHPVDSAAARRGGAADLGRGIIAGEAWVRRGAGGGPTAAAAGGDQVLLVQEEGGVDWVPVQVRNHLLWDPQVSRETRLHL